MCAYEIIEAFLKVNKMKVALSWPKTYQVCGTKWRSCCKFV